MRPYVFFLLLLLGPSLARSQDVMLLNLSRIGKTVQDIEPLLVTASTNAVAPTKVTLELQGVTVVGVLIEYPKRVTKEMVRDALNLTFVPSEKKFNSSQVYAWRDEQRKISFLVGDEKGITTLITRSIDKELLKRAMKTF